MDMSNAAMVPLAGWTVPRPVFKRIEVVEPPDEANPIVSLDMLKSHLRITHTSDDAYLRDMILPAAVQAVEQYTSRYLLTRTLKMWMDFIPGTGNEYMLHGSGSLQVPIRYANIGQFRWFDLLYVPVAAVNEIAFVTNSGETVVFDESNYIADFADPDMKARIILQRGCVWPVDLQVARSISVEYDVGYGEPADVPPIIKQCILMISAALWSNRGDNADQQPDILNFPAIRVALNPYRVMNITTL